MSADTEQILTRLAHALAPNMPGGAGQVDIGPTATLLIGQVVFVSEGPTVTYTVTLDGVHTRTGVPALVAPGVGDVVWVLEQPPILLILGGVPLLRGGPFRIGSSQLGSAESLDQP